MPPQSAQNRGEVAKGFLRRRADFLKTYKGKLVRKELLVVYARDNQQKQHRFGVTAPSAVGNAVVRNRFKRWSKEIYRKSDFSGLAVAVDINVFIGNKRKQKEDFKNVTFGDFEKQLREALQSLVQNFKSHGRNLD